MPQKIDNPTDIRKAMLRNGWTPLANLDKRCVLKDWSKIVVDDALIESAEWSRSKFKATGGRLDAALQGDNDTDHPVIDDINKAWAQAYPDVLDNADVPLLIRGTTASRKQSIFFRYVPTEGDPMRVIRTRRFAAPDGTDHHVAFYTGAGRQAGMIGAHNIETGSEYEWPFDSPLDTKLDDVPGMTKADCYRLCEIAEQVYADAGFTPVAGATGGESGGAHHFDIADDATFDCDDHVTRTVEEMVDAIKGNADLRCSASCIDGIPHGNRSRCAARVVGGVLIIHDFDTADDHSPKSVDPLAGTAALGSLLGEVAKEMGVELRTEPSRAEKRRLARGGAGRGAPPPMNRRQDNAADRRADELLDKFAFWPENHKGPVYALDAVTMEFGRAFKHFQLEQSPYSATVPWLTPQGAQTSKKLNPADIWVEDVERVTINDVVIRPDKPAGTTYSERGRTYLNIYTPPVHDALGGDATALHELMEQIAPDPIDRAWLYQRIAHKLRNPHIPGPGVLMVAQDEFGTGRGTFFALLGALFGARYTTEVPYRIFSGSATQAQYTDWLLNVIACVNEAEDTGELSNNKARKNAWANLKQYMEPRMYERMIVRKVLPNTRAMVCCSIFVAINDLEEVWLHEKDRRCFVFYNGFARDEAFWLRVNASIENPADVAAFARDLLALDVSSFNPYATPPLTQAKRDMAEAGKSDADIGLDIVIDHLRKTGAELFSMFHIINGMKATEVTNNLSYFEGWERHVRKTVGKRFKQIGERHGHNWSVIVDGKKYASFAWDEAGRRKWTPVTNEIVKRQLERAGKMDRAFGSTVGMLGDLLKGTPADQSE